MYTEKTPTVAALQWTGNNAQEITDTILAEITEGFYQGTTVGPSNELVIGLSYGMSLVITNQGWIVSAPGWGDAPRKYWGTGSVMILTNNEFQDRFTNA